MSPLLLAGGIRKGAQMKPLDVLIDEAYALLDKQRQGLGWPSPRAYDGRPLLEQARDLTVLLDAEAGRLRRLGRGEEAGQLETLSEALWDRAKIGG